MPDKGLVSQTFVLHNFSLVSFIDISFLLQANISTELYTIVVLKRAFIIIPHANCVCGGYIVFTLSVRACVFMLVYNVLFPKYIDESLLEFHLTLQTYSYLQDKYFNKKCKG